MSLRSISMRVPVDQSKQYGAFALIRADKDSQPHYLLQWNKKWGLFNLIGGKLDNNQGDDCSLARTIYRELEEELGLKPEEECLIVNLIQEVEMRQFSYREQRYKDYFFGIFEIDLFPRLPISPERKISAARWLATESRNQFISREEIENLCTKDGCPISVTTRRIMQSIEECAPFINSNYDTLLPTLKSNAHGLENKKRRTLQQMPYQIVCKLLSDGTTVYVNDEIAQVTGYQPNEIIGKNWWQVFFPGNGGYQVNQLYRLIKNGKPVNYEMTMTTRKHQLVTMHFTVSLQKSVQNNTCHILCMGR